MILVLVLVDPYLDVPMVPWDTCKVICLAGSGSFLILIGGTSPGSKLLCLVYSCATYLACE